MNGKKTHTHNTHVAVQRYIQYTMVCSHVVSNSVLFAESGDTTSLFANKEGSSPERRMEGGIADETSMPPLKCKMLWLGCSRTTAVVGTHGLDRFLDEHKMSDETRK